MSKETEMDTMELIKRYEEARYQADQEFGRIADEILPPVEYDLSAGPGTDILDELVASLELKWATTYEVPLDEFKALREQDRAEEAREFLEADLQWKAMKEQA